MKTITQKYNNTNLNIVKILNFLFQDLSEREQDILIRRFGLHGKKKETLESVGSRHSLTRERIRQIENATIKKLVKFERLEDEIKAIKSVMYEILEDHGGLMEQDYFLNSLLYFSTDNKEDYVKHRNHFKFLISKILYDEIEELSPNEHLKRAYKLKDTDINHVNEILEEFHGVVSNKKEVAKTDEMIKMFLELESYKKHQERLDQNYRFDMSEILTSDFFDEAHSTINSNKSIYSMLVVAKNIEQNKFGYWGRGDSREIKPKTINDKIYIILKNFGKPMHFADIAEKINSVGFDKKTSNTATVHNELILDDKYVLVGRGLYGLKEWGYKEGTVADVIKEILAEADGEMTRDEIINKVLDIRVVKKTTVILALMNKSMFDKVGDKYKVK